MKRAILMQKTHSIFMSPILVFTLFTALTATVSLEARDRDTRAPNIVLIMADDLGVGDLGCYGQNIIQTPRLDQLAGEGVRFTNFYCGNNVCAPSRCCLMTGKHSGHATIRDNANPKGMDDLKARYGWEFPGQIPIPESEVTLPQLLHDRGYACGAFGKWGLGHVGTTGDPARHGFDLFYGYYCQVHAHNHFPKFLWRNDKKEVLDGNDATLSGLAYSQELFVKEAMSFVRANRERPMFLYLPFTVPHLSLQVTDEALDQYDDLPEEEYKHTAYLKHPKPRAAYAAMVSNMDRGIGKIVDLFEELGLSDDTLFLFTSDNGPAYDRLGGTDSAFFNSAAGLKGHKGSMWEGGIRAPMIARWKNHTLPGKESNWLGASWDILPTVCEAAGIEIKTKLDGKSFLPLLLGQEQVYGHNYLYWESPGYGGQQAVRTSRWKAIRTNMHSLKKGGKTLKTELYELQRDPSESKDVADDNPLVVKQMEALFVGLHTPSSLFPFPAIDDVSEDVAELVAGGGDNEQATDVKALKLVEPFAVDFDQAGNMFVCEMNPNRVKKISKDGRVELVAGTGEKGFGGDDGPGVQAKLNGPHHILYHDDRLLIADTWNGSVRSWIPESQKIETIIGLGKTGFAGDGGPAKEALLVGTYSIDIDRKRNQLYIADLENKRIRKVDLSTGLISTVAGNGKGGKPIDGEQAIEQPLVDPRAVAVDEEGRVYVLERGGHALRMIDTDGRIVTVAGTGKQGFSGDDGEALQATMNGPKHLIVDRDQSVLIVDTENHAIRRYDPNTKKMTRVAGTGKPGSGGIGKSPLELELNRPHGVQRGPDGWLYISDSSNGRVVKVKGQ